MFLHLGADKMVPLRNLISIHDIKEKRANITKEFLKSAHQRDNIVHISNEKSKSFVITDDTIYYSPISAATLKKRANHVREIEENSAFVEQ